MCVGFRGRGHGVSGSLWVWAWVRFYRIEHTQKKKNTTYAGFFWFFLYNIETTLSWSIWLLGFVFLLFFFFVQPGIPNTENKIYYSGNLI